MDNIEITIQGVDKNKTIPKMDCHICPLCGKGVPSTHICPNLSSTIEDEMQRRLSDE
jgi:hypothetical protein